LCVRNGIMQSTNDRNHRFSQQGDESDDDDEKQLVDNFEATCTSYGDLRDAFEPINDFVPPPKYAIDRTQFWLNIVLLDYMTCFCVEFSRGLFIASTYGAVQHVADKLGEKMLLGLVVAAFSVGRLVSSTAWGYLSDYVSERLVFISSSAVSVIGCVLYIIAYVYKLEWLLILSRVVTGVGSGALSVVRANTAKITTTKQRTTYMAINGASQYAALGVAPFIVIAFSNFGGTGAVYDSFTAPAFILIGCNVINIIAFFIWFKDIDGAKIAKETPKTSSSMEKDPEWQMLVNIGIVFFIFFNFSSRSVFALVETVGSYIYVHQRGIEDKVKQNIESSLLFGYMGMGGLIMFLITMLLTKRVADNWLLLSAFVIIALGSLVLMASTFYTDQLAPLLVGFILIWSIAFPIKQTTIMSSFSKILGQKPQGAMMGWIGTFGSLGRVFMPLVSGVLSDAASIGIALGVSCLSCVLLLLYIVLVQRYRARYNHYSVIEPVS